MVVPQPEIKAATSITIRIANSKLANFMLAPLVNGSVVKYS